MEVNFHILCILGGLYWGMPLDPALNEDMLMY